MCLRGSAAGAGLSDVVLRKEDGQKHCGVVPQRPSGARGPLIQGYRQPSWISLLPRGGVGGTCVCATLSFEGKVIIRSPYILE